MIGSFFGLPPLLLETTISHFPTFLHRFGTGPGLTLLPTSELALTPLSSPVLTRVAIPTNASSVPQAPALIMVLAPATLAPSVPMLQVQATRFAQLVPTRNSFLITLSGPTLAKLILNVLSTAGRATRYQLILPFRPLVSPNRTSVTFQHKI